jgi:hypothetical protein
MAARSGGSAQGNPSQFDQKPAAVDLAQIDDLGTVFLNLLYAGDHVRKLGQPVLLPRFQA